MNSDQIVESLQPFGIVSVYQGDHKGFSAKAELFEYVMAEVRSDLMHPTMLSALKDLQQKVFALVSVERGE